MPKGDRAILKADPEDGHTPIANLLLEALAIAKLTGKEKGAVLYLCRQTYGWQKNGVRLKEAIISLKQWTSVLSTDKSHASSILSGLESKNIITRQFNGPGKGYCYSVNTRVAEWGNGCINQQRLREITKQPLPKTTTVGLPKTATPTATNLASRKETIKESINKDITDLDIDSLLNPKEAHKTWEAVLRELQLQVSKPNYRTWLKLTEGLGYKGGCFIVGAPSNFVAEYLDKNQRSLIEKTIIGITKRKIEVYFVDKKASSIQKPKQGITNDKKVSQLR